MSRTTTTIETRDGRCPASVFRPDAASGERGAPEGPWPAVLFYMDGIGIRPALFEMGERMASHGYLVLLPDLFYRAGPYEPVDARALFSDPAVRQAWSAKFISSVTVPLAMADTAAFLDWFSVQPDAISPRVGTTGYCMGGALALAAAGHFPDRVVAAASYHGARLATDAPESPHLLAPKMKARVYVAGAVEDASFPDAMKERLESALRAAGVEHTVETYAGARHGWVPSDTPSHDPAAAERHWETLFALLDARLAPRMATGG